MVGRVGGARATVRLRSADQGLSEKRSSRQAAAGVLLKDQWVAEAVVECAGSAAGWTWVQTFATT
jgi:hypothetical protein